VFEQPESRSSRQCRGACSAKEGFHNAAIHASHVTVSLTGCNTAQVVPGIRSAGPYSRKFLRTLKQRCSGTPFSLEMKNFNITTCVYVQGMHVYVGLQGVCVLLVWIEHRELRSCAVSCISLGKACRKAQHSTCALAPVACGYKYYRFIWHRSLKQDQLYRQDPCEPT
jgi:hypothetical protein